MGTDHGPPEVNHEIGFAEATGTGAGGGGGLVESGRAWARSHERDRGEQRT